MVDTSYTMSFIQAISEKWGVLCPWDNIQGWAYKK